MSLIPQKLSDELQDLGLNAMGRNCFGKMNSAGFDVGVWFQTRRVLDFVEASPGWFVIWEDLERLIARGYGRRFRRIGRYTITIPDWSQRFIFYEDDCSESVEAAVNYVAQNMDDRLAAFSTQELLEIQCEENYRGHGKYFEVLIALKLLTKGQKVATELYERFMVENGNTFEAEQVEAFWANLNLGDPQSGLPTLNQ